jgi:hypothetical protein
MDDMKDKISEKLGDALEIYREKTILRAILCAIPYIGSSLDVLLSSREKKFFIIGSYLYWSSYERIWVL